MPRHITSEQHLVHETTRGTSDATAEIRRPLRRCIALDVRTGVLLLVVFGIIRVALVLHSNVTGSYQVVSLVFVAMALLPWIVLTPAGRKRIRLVRPPRWRWMIPAAVTGVGFSLAGFALFTSLWGDDGGNPFVYIAGSYSAVPSGLSETNRLIYFVIFAVIGMLFSPVGEELLYRGVAHESLASRVGDRAAALIDAGAFSVVHLAHFGIVYTAGAWGFLPAPAALWVTAMFVSSLMFYAFRRLTGTVLGAIVAHAGFNLAMNFVIFYWLDLF